MTKEYIGIWRNGPGKDDIVIANPHGSPEEVAEVMESPHLVAGPYTIHEIGPALKKRTMYEVWRKENGKESCVWKSDTKQHAKEFVRGAIAHFLEGEGPSYLTVTDQGEYVSHSTKDRTLYYEIRESADWIPSD